MDPATPDSHELERGNPANSSRSTPGTLIGDWHDVDVDSNAGSRSSRGRLLNSTSEPVLPVLGPRGFVQPASPSLLSSDKRHSGNFSSAAIVEASAAIQAWWRLHRKSLAPQEPASSPPWPGNVHQPPRMLHPSTAATVISRCFKRWRYRATFSFFRKLLGFRNAGDPRSVLKALLPCESHLLEPALQARVRLRLAGPWPLWPPSVVFRVYVQSPLSDVNAFAPRDYEGERCRAERASIAAAACAARSTLPRCTTSLPVPEAVLDYNDSVAALTSLALAGQAAPPPSSLPSRSHIAITARDHRATASAAACVVRVGRSLFPAVIREGAADARIADLLAVKSCTATTTSSTSSGFSRSSLSSTSSSLCTTGLAQSSSLLSIGAPVDSVMMTRAAGGGQITRGGGDATCTVLLSSSHITSSPEASSFFASRPNCGNNNNNTNACDYPSDVHGGSALAGWYTRDDGRLNGWRPITEAILGQLTVGMGGGGGYSLGIGGVRGRRSASRRSCHGTGRRGHRTPGSGGGDDAQPRPPLTPAHVLARVEAAARSKRRQWMVRLYLGSQAATGSDEAITGAMQGGGDGEIDDHDRAAAAASQPMARVDASQSPPATLSPFDSTWTQTELQDEMAQTSPGLADLSGRLLELRDHPDPGLQPAQRQPQQPQHQHRLSAADLDTVDEAFLLQWSDGLDFDSYMASWRSLGTTVAVPMQHR